MAKNLPQVISDLKNGKGVFVGSPLFVREDGAVVDVEDREQFPASALGKAAYDEFEGMSAPSDVSGAISTHNTDAGAHAGLFGEVDTLISANKKRIDLRTPEIGSKHSLRAKIFDDCSDYTSFTSTNCALSEETSIYKILSKSVKINITGELTANVKKTSQSIDMINNDIISFWIYVPDGSAINRFILYISSTDTFSKAFQYTESRIRLGWNCFKIHKSEFTNTNSDSWGVMKAFQVTVVTTGSMVCYLGAVMFGQKQTPSVVFSFDDITSDHYSGAYPLFNARNITGSIGVISSLVGGSGRMTLAQLVELKNAGWDMCNHSSGTTSLTTMTTAKEVYNALSDCDNYMKSNALSNLGNEFIFYPNGVYNDSAVEVIRAMGFLGARTIIKNNQALPVDDWYRLMSVESGTYLQNKPYIDAVIANGNALIFTYHTLDSAGLTELQLTLDYCISQGVAIETLSQLYQRVNSSY